VSNYLLTTGRNGDKIHRPTCKKATANAAAVETDDYTAGDPATCCKPKPIDAPAAAPAKAPTKAKPAAAMATPEPKPAEPVVYDDPAERLAASRAEWKAAKAAKKAGQPIPPTPNLDAMNADHAAGKKFATKKPKGEGRQRIEVTVRFVRGPELDKLKPMPDSQNKLSSVAYYHTRGVTGWNETGDVPRCTTEMLRSILEHHGVTNPEQTPFEPVLLANGTWLAAEPLS
jgi:hypothetical protein